MRLRIGAILGAGLFALAAGAPAQAATYNVTGTADGTGTCTGTSPNFSCTTLRGAAPNATTARAQILPPAPQTEVEPLPEQTPASTSTDGGGG